MIHGRAVTYRQSARSGADARMRMRSLVGGRGCVTRRKLQTRGIAKEHNRQGTPTISANDRRRAQLTDPAPGVCVGDEIPCVIALPYIPEMRSPCMLESRYLTTVSSLPRQVSHQCRDGLTAERSCTVPPQRGRWHCGPVRSGASYRTRGRPGEEWLST